MRMSFLLALFASPQSGRKRQVDYLSPPFVCLIKIEGHSIKCVAQGQDKKFVLDTISFVRSREAVNNIFSKSFAMNRQE